MIRVRLEKENKLLSEDSTFVTLDCPTRFFTIKKVKAVIKNLNPKKTPGYDLIINQILQKLLEMGIKYINQLSSS